MTDRMGGLPYFPPIHLIYISFTDVRILFRLVFSLREGWRKMSYTCLLPTHSPPSHFCYEWKLVLIWAGSDMGSRQAHRGSQAWITKWFYSSCATSTVIPAPWRLRQEDHKLEASLCYITRLCFKKSHKTKTKGWERSSRAKHWPSICEALGLTLPITTKERKKSNFYYIWSHALPQHSLWACGH